MINGITPSLDALIAWRFQVPAVGLFNRQRVQHSQSGAHLSTARGRGIDFAETRAYHPGDDIRLINWKLTAKMGKPYTKVYHEERERPVYFIVDQNSSMHFGTRVCFKQVLAANLFALLGWSALAAEQQVGAILVGDHRFSEVAARRSRQNLLQTFKQLVDWQNQVGETAKQIERSLMRLNQQAKAGSTSIILSDCSHFNQTSWTLLKQLSHKNELMICFIYDSLEVQAPSKGRYQFSDGAQHYVVLNASQAKQRQQYQAWFAERRRMLEKFCRQYNIRLIPVATHDDLQQVINREVRYVV